MTLLTAQAALEALRAQGVSEEQLPSPSTMAEVLNRVCPTFYTWRFLPGRTTHEANRTW